MGHELIFSFKCKEDKLFHRVFNKQLFVEALLKTFITRPIGVSSIGAGGARAPPKFSEKSLVVHYFLESSALFLVK